MSERMSEWLITDLRGFESQCILPIVQYAVWKNAELLWDQNVHVQIRRCTAKTLYEQFEVPTSSLALRGVLIYDFRTRYSSFVVFFCLVLNTLMHIRR